MEPYDIVETTRDGDFICRKWRSGTISISLGLRGTTVISPVTAAKIEDAKQLLLEDWEDEE